MNLSSSRLVGQPIGIYIHYTYYILKNVHPSNNQVGYMQTRRAIRTFGGRSKFQYVEELLSTQLFNYTSCSIEQGCGFIRSKTDGLRTYIPALILLPTYSWGLNCCARFLLKVACNTFQQNDLFGRSFHRRQQRHICLVRQPIAEILVQNNTI